MDTTTSRKLSNEYLQSLDGGSKFEAKECAVLHSPRHIIVWQQLTESGDIRRHLGRLELDSVGTWLAYKHSADLVQPFFSSHWRI